MQFFVKIINNQQFIVAGGVRFLPVTSHCENTVGLLFRVGWQAFFVEKLSKTLTNIMKAQQSKEYRSPQFQLVRQDEQNKVFFTASGGPSGSDSVTGSISSMSSTSATSW